MEPLEQVSELLPPTYRAALTRMAAEERERISEVRLRRGSPPSVLAQGKERLLPVDGEAVSEGVLQYVLNCAAEFSVYAAQSVADGYLTVQGGHRIGLCGTAVMEQGRVKTIRDLSSLAIRVARSVPHIGDELAEQLHKRGTSALIIGPPGSGKTTLLRDTIRALSDTWDQRISVVDERSELSGMYRGAVQLPLGRRTDVLCGCPKEQGIALVLRSMNPQWIALDEITSPEDVRAMEHASYCGVRLLATAHADSVRDFCGRPVYQALLKLGFFSCAWVLDPACKGHLEELPPWQDLRRSS